ncbi:DUF6161 domain-containing protein [Pseudomonas sp. A34-9]|uniref:DUF6161 domain-containing protein n=1 Tax=Pseudomonas sp. A34-9 TaxID=3034675 RepID=UPI00240DAB20|nr:DUF6161 domain-containing protein [Pseudomonas sp. A34-9]
MNEITNILEHKKFSSISKLDTSELIKWKNDEINFWSENLKKINQNKNQAHLPSISQATINKITTYIQQLEKSKEIIPSNEAKEQIINFVYEANLPNHDEHVSQILTINAYAPLKFELILISYELSLNSELSALTEIYTQKATLLAESTNLKINETIKKFNNELEVKIESEKKNIQATVERINETSAAAVERIKNAVSAGTEAVNLSEPVRYWNERRSTHQENAIKNGKRAVFSACTFLSMLVLLIAYEYAAGRELNYSWGTINLPKNNFSIAFLIVFTTAGIWCTRIFIKLMMANISLESESLERSTMIKTYVAMIAINGSPDADKQTLFYTTLFRPTQSSFSEEGTAPEFSRILEIIMKK